jgi:hypothetical protein
VLTWTQFYELLAIACWLLIALGFALAIVAQRRGEQRMSPLQASLVAFPLLVIFVCRYQSGLNLLAQDLIHVVGSCSACVVGIYLWCNPDKLVRGNPAMRHPKFWAFMIFVAGISLGANGVLSLSGDFIMQRDETTGTVTKKYIRNDRFGRYYYVEIDGRRFPTTADVYAQIQPLSHVHATVGRGTGNILDITN